MIGEWQGRQGSNLYSRDQSPVLCRLSYAPLAVIVSLLAGCAHCPVDTPIGLPERPELIPVTPEVWSTVGPEAQDTWTLNDLALKEYIKKLEARIQLHDDRF